MENFKQIFLSLENHPLPSISKGFKRLKREELQATTLFIDEELGSCPIQNEIKINRLFINSETRTKNWLNIVELLAIANSRFKTAKEKK